MKNPIQRRKSEGGEKRGRLTVRVKDQSQRGFSPPWSPLSSAYIPSPAHVSHGTHDPTEYIDELDIGTLRHSLAEYEQYRRVEAARRRRDIHLRVKSYHSLHRNQKSLEVSCIALQKQWTEEVEREKYSALLKRSDADSVMLRKVRP